MLRNFFSFLAQRPSQSWMMWKSGENWTFRRWKARIFRGKKWWLGILLSTKISPSFFSRQISPVRFRPSDFARQISLVRFLHVSFLHVIFLHIRFLHVRFLPLDFLSIDVFSSLVWERFALCMGLSLVRSGVLTLMNMIFWSNVPRLNSEFVFEFFTFII